MKCAVCGNDAIGVVNQNELISFALCESCISKRRRKPENFHRAYIELDDVWDRILEAKAEPKEVD